MPALTPEDLHRLFAEAANAGDAERAETLFEPEPTFVPQPGEIAAGTVAIREHLGRLVGMRPRMAIETAGVLAAGDIALLYSRWTATAVGADGQPIELSGDANEVARRQADGTWLVVIDNPYGRRVLDAVR